MDLDVFIALERKRLEAERELLMSRRSRSSDESKRPAEEISTNKNNDELNSNSNQNNMASVKTNAANANTLTGNDRCIEALTISSPRPALSSSISTGTLSSMATTPRSRDKQDMSHTSSASPSVGTCSVFIHDSPAKENENVAISIGASTPRRSDHDVALVKSAKEWVNKQEMHANNLKENNAEKENLITSARSSGKHRNKDDMDQWVSDTFYSYFPGFNNELQKRQNYLRERQRDYEQNFLRHQMAHPPAVTKHASIAAAAAQNAQMNTARSNTSTNSTSTTTTTATSHTTDKTDLEIIVNNPDYTPPKHLNTTVRPGTNRHRLLQDLRHTEFDGNGGGDGGGDGGVGVGDNIAERNKRHVEMELSRKKEYQRELMQQIEEKRRSIELLKEKERLQEEALTRRLQEQLKTIRLEEQLEKEKMRADRLRFDAAQSRLMREHLLAKLENDAKVLHAKQEANAKAAESPEDLAAKNEGNSNRVYKYFSNSARHEYRRGQPLPAEVDVCLDIATALNTERECFHLSEKVCPMCDAPLKSFESCCLRCQKKLSLDVREKPARVEKSHSEESKRADDEETNASASTVVLAAPTESAAPPAPAPAVVVLPDQCDESSSQEALADGKSFSLVCFKCERLYALCPTCLAKNDVCRACHRKRNVCMNCRRTLCSFCLEEIATGRDAERSHINEHDTTKKQTPAISRNDAGSERSFQILDVKMALPDEAANDSVNQSSPSPSPLSPHPFASDSPPANNTVEISDSPRPPYSINIERNSIFHPDQQIPTLAKQNNYASYEQLPKFNAKKTDFETESMASTDESENIERMRKETDRRLSRYLKNYGDLAEYKRSKSESRNRSTQTTPQSAGRRDVVLHEEHNLSMPLLREMPRMTRREHGTSVFENSGLYAQRKIDNLKRRWEVPAVQRYTISNTSPKVLTQVGAIRKQLQAQRLLEDDVY